MTLLDLAAGGVVGILVRNVCHTFRSTDRTGSAHRRYRTVLVCLLSVMGLVWGGFLVERGILSVGGGITAASFFLGSRLGVAFVVFSLYRLVEEIADLSTQGSFRRYFLLGICLLFAGANIAGIFVENIQSILLGPAGIGLFGLLVAPFPVSMASSILDSPSVKKALGTAGQKSLLIGLFLFSLAGVMVVLNTLSVPALLPGWGFLGIAILILHPLAARGRSPELRRFFGRAAGLVTSAFLFGAAWHFIVPGGNPGMESILLKSGWFLMAELAALEIFSWELDGEKKKYRSEAFETISNTLSDHLEDTHRSIRMLTELVDRKISPDEKGREIQYFNEKIKEKSENMKQLVRGMRVLNNGVTMERTYLNPEEPVRESTNRLRTSRHRDAAEFVLDVDPNLPRIYGNHEGLSRVLEELMINAAEAVRESDSGHGEIEIRFTHENGLFGEGVRVSIEDEGEPLPDISSDRLLEPFVTTRQDHFGLGLSLVRNVLEYHDSNLSIEQKNSVEGSGRVRKIFSFVLPAENRDP